MFNYIQGIMLTLLEMICCKIFFEIFAEKRSENVWRNYGIFVGTIICGYSIALIFYDYFFIKQIIVVIVVALFMILYLKIGFGKALILSLLFQGMLLSIDYFTLWLNVSLFHSISEINELHYVGGSLVMVFAKVLLFFVCVIDWKEDWK